MTETESAGAEYAFPNGKWLESVGMQDSDGKIVDAQAVVLADPDDLNFSRRANKTVTDVVIPSTTEAGSFVVALSKSATASPGENAKGALVQLFEVVVTEDGTKVLKPVPQGQYLSELRKQATLELIDEKQKLPGSNVTRRLEPLTATAKQLAKPKQIKDASLCQRLPSQSPYINMGMVTRADLEQFRREITETKTVQIKNTLLDLARPPTVGRVSSATPLTA